MQKLGLKQTTTQKLTPQQIQFISLLQIPGAAMESRIAEELEDNPTLKQEVGEGEEISESPLPNEVVADQMPLHSYTTKQAFASTQSLLINQLADTHVLHDIVLKQLLFLPLTPQEQLFARHLVGNLDEKGYLLRDLEMILAELELKHGSRVSRAAAEKVLQQLKSLDPAGIGARNLQECLLLQLQRKEPTETVKKAVEVIEGFFELFSRKRYKKLAKALKMSFSQLKPVIDEITCLSPYPIIPPRSGVDQSPLEPDFMVHMKDGKLTVKLIEKKMPRLVIDNHYYALLRQHRKSSTASSKETVDFLQQKINRGKWFIQAIEQRRLTLLRIIKALVELQRAFFETMDESTLRPIFLRNVAERIDMDVSTVSRAISNKALQTDWYVYPLKYFFSEPIPTTDGREVSSRLIKQKISQLIATEDKRSPLTDEKILQTLQSDGYLLARRTVAKYRQQLSIPVARMRRALLM